MGKRTCCVSDCEREVGIRKWCGLHYQRGRADGSIVNATPEQLSWENVDALGELPACPSGAKLIPLTGGAAFAIVDAGDYDWLTKFRWWPHASGYAYRHTYHQNGSYAGYAGCIMMHRAIMGTPHGWDTDHINRNPLDNRRSNLRITDRTQNNFNSGLHTNNTSGHRGVSWNKRTKSWRAYIGGSKGRVELGHFKNIEDAIVARLAAEEIHIEKCA